MKTFVLAAVLLLPTALSAQVLIPSRGFESDAGTYFLRPPTDEDIPHFVIKRGPAQAPTIDYKLRVARPSRESKFRMLVERPDSRYDYKILTPQHDSARASSRRAPKR